MDYHEDYHENRWLALAILSVLVMIALLFSVKISPARDLDGSHADSPLKPWFNNLASKKGLCCSVADGHAIEDADWESKDGHYRVHIPPIIGDDYVPMGDPIWVDVPDDAVVTTPNLVGRTMIWPMYLDGHISVRCFMPGSMT